MELVAVQGYLEEGIFYSDQPLPAGKVPAVLTFVADSASVAPQKDPKPRPRFSWDEALALTAGSTTSLSDAVIEERREGE